MLMIFKKELETKLCSVKPKKKKLTVYMYLLL